MILWAKILDIKMGREVVMDASIGLEWGIHHPEQSVKLLGKSLNFMELFQRIHILPITSFNIVPGVWNSSTL